MIWKKSPSNYMREVENGRTEGAFSSMLDSHFISKSDSLLSDNNFERFLSERQENLHKQIKAKTTPPSK